MSDSGKSADKNRLMDSHYNTSLKPGDSITVEDITFVFVAKEGNWARVRVICPRSKKIKKTRSMKEMSFKEES